MSIYPPGMTARDWDHVDGVGTCTCPDCRGDLDTTAVEGTWRCPHCDTFYNDELEEIYLEEPQDNE